MWNPPDIGSEDMSWLFSVPDLALSDLVHNGWDLDESQSSPNVIVASDIPECPSISSSDEVSIVSSEGEGRVEMIQNLGSEDVHNETSSIEVSEGELSKKEIRQSKSSQEFINSPVSVISMVGLNQRISINQLFK